MAKGSPAAARGPRLKLRPRLTRKEVAGVSYALLTPGIQRSFIDFKSQAGTIEQREEAFIPAFLQSRGDLHAHRGVAIGCGHGNLLGVCKNNRGVQMKAGHRPERVSIVEGRNPHVMSLRNSGHTFDLRQAVQPQVRPHNVYRPPARRLWNAAISVMCRPRPTGIVDSSTILASASCVVTNVGSSNQMG